MKKILFSIIIMLIVVLISYAQESVNSQVSEIKVELFRAQEDFKGTDSANIYTVEVGYANEGYVSDQLYMIVYFLDGHPVEGFDNKILPFSFRRNFRGQVEGIHEVKIELHDKDGNVLAGDSADFSVVKVRQ